MTNGYIVLTKGDSKLYQHAIEAINLGKPIYFVDAENKAIYFGDKISLDGTNVVINAGNDIITIDADGNATVTNAMPHLGVLKVGYSSQDTPMYIVYLFNKSFDDFDDSFDSTDKIDGLYNVLKEIGILDYRFATDNKYVVISSVFNDNNTCTVTMKVDDSNELLATVDSEDNITYTTSDDYFYISYKQLF